jgi:choline dehydrogenase-like flavoprotein
MNRAETWSSPATGKSSLINSTTSTASLAASNGKNGPVAASYGIYRTDLDAPLTRASATLGFPLNSNPDGGSSTYLPEFGVANSIDPVSRNRSYAVTAYYKPVASRSNLQVLTGALATKLVWKSSTLNSSAVTASGVQFTVGGKTYTVNAAKEVILSAGGYFDYCLSLPIAYLWIQVRSRHRSC